MAKSPDIRSFNASELAGHAPPAMIRSSRSSASLSGTRLCLSIQAMFSATLSTSRRFWLKFGYVSGELRTGIDLRVTEVTV